jgi:replication factor C subunit 2/4
MHHISWRFISQTDPKFTGAVHDRGIDVVRNKIKMFAQKKVTLPPGRHKIILLDEADRFALLLPKTFKRTHQLA